MSIKEQIDKLLEAKVKEDEAEDKEPEDKKEKDDEESEIEITKESKGSKKCNEDDEDDEESDEKDEDDKGSDDDEDEEEKTESKKSSKKSMKEHIDALTDGESLTEEFKTKATTIFEAAVLDRVKEEVQLVEEKMENEKLEALRELKEELTEKIDGYLDFVVEKWMKDNELALEPGIKNQIFENFISSMKEVFEESYIEMPDEKYDLVEDLTKEVAESRDSLNEAIAVAVEYKRLANKLQKEALINEATSDLSRTDAARFKELTEDLDFSDEDTFSDKLETIKESYFSKTDSRRQSLNESFITDKTPTYVEEQTVAPQIKAYTDYLTKNKGK